LTVDNALDPNLMTATERLTEIGEILAAGLVRLRAKEREKGDRRELSLDFTGTRSVPGRKARDRERP
jgi:hypothetical protein